MSAGLPPAAVCKPRPSQGQAEPLGCPLLPSSWVLQASSPFGVLFSFSFTANSSFSNPCSSLWVFLLFCCSQWGTKQWRRKERKIATTCCTQSYLQCRAPLWAPLLSPPSFFPRYCWGRVFSFSVFLLPPVLPFLCLQYCLVPHFATCLDIDNHL